MKIEGKCHCGNITCLLRWPGEGTKIPVRARGCTFCTKHGGTYTSHRDAALAAVVHDEDLVSHYRFGTRTAEFYLCSRCGVVPFVTSVVNPKFVVSRIAFPVLRAGSDARAMPAHRQAALTPTGGWEKRPFGRPFRSLGPRCARLVMRQHHGGARALPRNLKGCPGYDEFRVHHTSMIEDNLYAVVNVNSFEGIDPSCFSRAVADFDGETTESRLDRRKRNWIPSVTVASRRTTPQTRRDRRKPVRVGWVGRD